MSRDDWLGASITGLAKLVEHRGKKFVLEELLQNCWDENVKKVIATLELIEGRRLARVRVEDDSPDGYADITHAFILFAESKKKSDPSKRGRFNAGEKLVLSLCEGAVISTTTGTLVFDEKGRHRKREKRERGSVFEGVVKMTKAEFAEVCAAMNRLIPPGGIVTTFNGQEIPHRKPLKMFTATLPTVISDDEGNLRPTSRQTKVSIYEPLPGEVPSIYEMGIPVVETGDKWHIDVCVAPETKILTGDLRHIPASSVTEGMVLLGFDENRVENRRRFRSSIVKSVRRIQRPCSRLTFDDGTVVVCSDDHQWLTARSRTRRWLSTAQMVPTIGDRMGSNVVRIVDVWEESTSYAGGYLAAAFDGEGCLTQRPAQGVENGVVNRLQFVQTDNEMLEKMVSLLKSEGFDPVITRRSRIKENWKEVTNIRLRDRREMLKFLGRYRPARLLPKLNLDALGTIPGQKFARLVKKEALGLQEVIAIETSTHTFIAEGLASHNCQKVPLNSDRDNVTPAYLRTLRTLVVNEMVDYIKGEDAAANWIKDPLADKNIKPEAVVKLLDEIIPGKKFIFDPSDLESNNRGVSHGGTPLKGRMFPKPTWDNIHKTGAYKPAGQLWPTSRVEFHPDGEELKIIKHEDMPEGMKRIVNFTKAIAPKVLDGVEVVVEVCNNFNVGAAAFYGKRHFTYNVGRLGFDWFKQSISDEEVCKLVQHELAHEIESNHLDEKYHDAICTIGARMTFLALSEPKFFKQFED